MRSILVRPVWLQLKLSYGTTCILSTEYFNVSYCGQHECFTLRILLKMVLAAINPCQNTFYSFANKRSKNIWSCLFSIKEDTTPNWSQPIQQSKRGEPSAIGYVNDYPTMHHSGISRDTQSVIWYYGWLNNPGNSSQKLHCCWCC